MLKARWKTLSIQSKSLRREVTHSPTLAILLALVLPGSRQPTRCFGIWVMTFHLCLTSVQAAYVSEARLPDLLQHHGGCRRPTNRCDVTSMETGDVIIIKPYDGRILDEQGKTVTEFSLSSQVILDEVRAGGRIPLIIGRGLTLRAREVLGSAPLSSLERQRHLSSQAKVTHSPRRWLGRPVAFKAFGGTYCEPA